MLIDEQRLLHWMEHFFGFGSWNARVWLVAFEETGGNLPEDVSERLTYFSNRHGTASGPTLCDLRDMFRHIGWREEGAKASPFKTLFEQRFGDDAPPNRIWQNLIQFVHASQGKTLKDGLAYQRNQLASASENNEALIRLYPLPASHDHGWYYAWLGLPVEYLRRRQLYEAHLFEARLSAILQKLRKHKPELVLMYGMGNINTLKEEVRAAFPETMFSMTKAVKLKIPQHHVADIGPTRLVITTQIPALRHQRVETGFDWSAFGSLVARPQ